MMNQPQATVDGAIVNLAVQPRVKVQSGLEANSDLRKTSGRGVVQGEEEGVAKVDRGVKASPRTGSEGDGAARLPLRGQEDLGLHRVVVVEKGKGKRERRRFRNRRDEDAGSCTPVATRGQSPVTVQTTRNAFCTIFASLLSPVSTLFLL
jgi:hypothetical protein